MACSPHNLWLITNDEMTRMFRNRTPCQEDQLLTINTVLRNYT